MASDRCIACDGDGSTAVVVERRDTRRRGQLGWAWQGCVLCAGAGRVEVERDERERERAEAAE